jgi:predicted RNA-binding Zn-ribbon protein involved in translation (DUF1610 family)
MKEKNCSNVTIGTPFDGTCPKCGGNRVELDDVCEDTASHTCDDCGYHFGTETIDFVRRDFERPSRWIGVLLDGELEIVDIPFDVDAEEFIAEHYARPSELQWTELKKGVVCYRVFEGE